LLGLFRSSNVSGASLLNFYSFLEIVDRDTPYIYCCINLENWYNLINIMSTLILTRIFIAAAAVFGGLSVVGGAFASHALKNQLTDRALAIFETGARYQMYHALALLLVALLLNRALESQTFFAVAGWAFIVGTIVFSGSLYALSLISNGWVQSRRWAELLLLSVGAVWLLQL
jgi:uncharacterized membrane protein YgdD (TMEM256/DUF423 family)